MKRLLNKILISIIVLGGILLFGADIFAQPADPLVVEFQATPLFDEDDIKPCDITQKWIKVTNYSGENLDILIKATDFISPIPADDLSRVMVINIKEGTNDLYGPKTLAEFYLENGVSLGNISNGTMLQYDIVISISCDEGNEWQAKRTGFNLEINGSGDNAPDGGVGGDGGGLKTGGGVSGGHLVTCGDNIRELDEQCDDGNTINGDGCSSICRTEEIAGALTEQQGGALGQGLGEDGEVLGESTTLPNTGGIMSWLLKDEGSIYSNSQKMQTNILIAGIFILVMIGLVVIRKIVSR
jgi:cysteine-rich repeat protein